MIGETYGRLTVIDREPPTGPAKNWERKYICCPGQTACGRCNRGLLCSRCNSIAGFAFDEPQTLRSIADYLESAAR